MNKVKELLLKKRIELFEKLDYIKENGGECGSEIIDQLDDEIEFVEELIEELE